jgi:predicted transcriptional regulator of viral defense system
MVVKIMIKTASILLDELKTYYNPRAKIHQLVKSKNLFPVVKGIYETVVTTPGYYLANAIYGPSYLSFEFALAFHNLIPEMVYTYTSATCEKKRRKQYITTFGTFTYRDVPVNAFPFEKTIYQENGYSYIVANPEKAICDFLYAQASCANRNELKQLLFEQTRIEYPTFQNLDKAKLLELANLYNTRNHKLLIAWLRRLTENE